MTQKDFNKKLTKQLSSLPAYRTVEFGLYVCRKLYPDYVFFSVRNQWGDANLLQEAIDYCDANKHLKDIKNFNTQRLIGAVDIITPDTEDFGDWDGSYALNACTAVLDLLGYLIDGDVSHAINISSYVTDTIDFQLQEADSTLTHLQLINHPLIKEEQEYQLRITKPDSSLLNKIIQWIKGG
ncbi:DUF416 family protein [Mucilaginibacter sp. ZT4R22]|uniref:DUF416 family protein n=1 Tax=Mucilaginibacter pankratovii TaxID=2772110 RepID=A0ABR7WY61_9SPHI|nr:DUF416 family protein [Mucilaginibacter pankratovii]MBD1366212.1 DUF416 family protein [Mucilaginibacter pankratovii]